MTKYQNNLTELNRKGFSVSSPVFKLEDLKYISNLINEYLDNNNIQKYAIRNLFSCIPELFEYIFNNSEFINFKKSILLKNYFLTKSIYFNKPSMSNWFVAYHQDLSISAKHKKEIKGFSNWTKKNDVFGVQPPKSILKNTITLRIHLDNTDNTNGALKVIEESHNNGIIRIDEKFNALDYGKEKTCDVSTGDIMLMKPLTLHSSNKSISKNDRRVIHLEFCCENIPKEISWYEKINFN